MTGRQAVELCGLLDARTVVPVHYEGWSHFVQGRAALERELARAPDDVRRRFCWLQLGRPVDCSPIRPAGECSEGACPGGVGYRLTATVAASSRQASRSAGPGAPMRLSGAATCFQRSAPVMRWMLVSAPAVSSLPCT